jgi:hypothetical protein
MTIAALKDEVELWTEEAYNKLHQRFLYELTKEEQAILLWNFNAWLNTLIKQRAQSL